MKPDWREIGRLEQEIYGRVISDEAVAALVMPRSGIGYENIETMQKRARLLRGED